MCYDVARRLPVHRITGTVAPIFRWPGRVKHHQHALLRFQSHPQGPWRVDGNRPIEALGGHDRGARTMLHAPRRAIILGACQRRRERHKQPADSHQSHSTCNPCDTQLTGCHRPKQERTTARNEAGTIATLTQNDLTGLRFRSSLYELALRRVTTRERQIRHRNVGNPDYPTRLPVSSEIRIIFRRICGCIL